MFKIRCSAIGQMMSNDRSGKQIGKTAITNLHNYLKSDIYGKEKSFYSKETQKGILLENDAIEEVIKFYNLPFVLKNELRFQNDFITGTPDLILEDKIIDIKCPWDCFTFPLFDTELPNTDYYWQMQGYMELTGKDVAEVIYVLLTTPPELNYGVEDSYEHVPIEQRIKKFTIERNDADIERINQRVIECRQIISQLNFK
jgi:hypothetical protein